MSELRYPFLDLKRVNESYFKEFSEIAEKAIGSGRYIGGEAVDSFNRHLALVCNAPHAIGVSNGLDALRLIFEAYKCMGMLCEHDEVIVAANTYIASILAITHAGLTPVLVDPDESTFNLSAKGIKSALTHRTRAILLVDLYGRINWDNQIRQIVSDHSLIVIEDAAQAIGAESEAEGMYKSHKAGAIGHAGALSFYPTKNIGALGDAGAVVTHDQKLASTVRALANYGSDRRYHNIHIGFNCRLDPLQAEFLNIKLRGLESVSRRRIDRANIYSNLIINPLVRKPDHPINPEESVWHQYVVRIDADKRERFVDHLRSHGIATDIHYPTPPHLQPCYRRQFAGQSFPLTERLAAECVSLPMGDYLNANDLSFISSAINSFK